MSVREEHRCNWYNISQISFNAQQAAEEEELSSLKLQPGSPQHKHKTDKRGVSLFKLSG